MGLVFWWVFGSFAIFPENKYSSSLLTVPLSPAPVPFSFGLILLFEISPVLSSFPSSHVCLMVSKIVHSRTGKVRACIVVHIHSRVYNFANYILTISFFSVVFASEIDVCEAILRI